MRIGRLMAVLASVLVFAFAARVHGQATKADPSATATHVMMAANDITWGPGPESLPAGAQLAVLDGDPSKAGAPFVVQAKLPDGYTVPPHWHPTDENVTVLTGTLQMAMGKTLKPSALKDLSAGSFALMPAKQPHMARAKGDTVIQIHAIGPFEVTYVNPKDDPRKKMTSTSTGK